MDTSTVEHRCLPRADRPCPQCGDSIPPPAYCGTCGADTSPRHVCQPRPLPHTCQQIAAPGRCIDCSQALPAPVFCTTCGANITPSHRCPAAPSTHIHRPDPVHTCPAHTLDRCPDCGDLLPGQAFCADCGMDITLPHACAPQPAHHVCPPHLTIPRRCSACGEVLPAPQHCTTCGADITPKHVCAAGE